jgi:hypothetical protein
MAWQVDIHVIDVGAGDSSLIIADEPVGNHRVAMLVDGGLSKMARFVHSKVLAVSPGGVDKILVSHYDQDHSIGVCGLLLADNMWQLCDLMAQIAVNVMPVGARRQMIARAAARVTAAACGAWGPNAGQANAPGVAAAAGVPAGSTDLEAADFGIATVTQAYGALLIPPVPTREEAAQLAAVAAADAAVAAGATLATVRTAVRTALFTKLQTNLPPGARFETGGIYRQAQIIDIGNATPPGAAYTHAINGRVLISLGAVVVPGAVRPLLHIPPLGSELLWGGAPPAPNGPRAIVVSTPLAWNGAATGTGWRGPNPPHAPAQFQGGTLNNCASIGIVLVMGNFAHFAAGDLPSQGEDPIGQALMDFPLPDGAGGTMPAALERVASLKCSHHGSAASSSDNFVDEIDSMTAALSCGRRHQNPSQRVIDTLHGAVNRFFLTNCSYPRTHVPFSTGGNQLLIPGTRGLVSGDNAVLSAAAGRNRGDIRISVTEADAFAGVGYRHHRVHYWEQSAVPPAPRSLLYTY